MNYKVVAQAILEACGGKTNIQNCEHCATRLRIILVDDSKIDAEKIEQLKEEISGYFYQTGQHQFIIGTGKVNNVYDAFIQLIDKTDNTSGNSFKEDMYANLKPHEKLIRILADILLPLIPALVTTGLLMGIRGLITNLGVVMDPNFQTLFEMLTDTAFAFLPVLITYSATKRFGGNPILGIVVGLMMVSPNLPNAWAVAGGDASPMVFNFFGLDLNIIGYQGSVLPGIAAGWILSKTEAKLRTVVPSVMDLIVTPFVSVLVSISVILFLVGPVLHFVEQGATHLVLMLLELPFGIGYMIFAGVQQLITITGLHHAFSVIEIQLISETGGNVLQPLYTATMAGQLGAAIGVVTLLKDRKKRSNALSASFSTLFGITEPILFGVNLPYFKAFVMGMLGGAAGGLVVYILGLAPNGMGITFIPGMLLYTDSIWNLLGYLLVIAVPFTVAFILTRMFVKVEN